ncbi:hypothetical protein NQ317_007643 [Molorchus minor]|uniref:Tyrosine specific protein phosphatases domain-containing protein n=1 Tax=Molorchus minor TaxID=1323400 RepID=A0ABQ9IUG2_9CUCU|nr:hypothetical protein NQ317_007643 [Molorchus minor]
MEEYSEISYKTFKFLISKNPAEKNIDAYVKDLKKRNVKAVVRVCQPTYDTEPLDGTSPGDDILESFFKILKNQYDENPESCIAVHCIAGLGRAPVLIAVALIELGYTYEDAVELIRSKRRGAINTKQLEFLAKYKPKSRLKNDKKNSCSIQ